MVVNVVSGFISSSYSIEVLDHVGNWISVDSSSSLSRIERAALGWKAYKTRRGLDPAKTVRIVEN